MSGVSRNAITCGVTAGNGDLQRGNTMEAYRYKNISLTGKVAEKLIIELFDKQARVPYRTIVEKVTEYHISQDGLPKTTEKSLPIDNGLNRLKKRKPK